MQIQYIAIAAMARNRIIGNNGKIPWYIPEDFKHFRETTAGSPIIMGRKTFESIGRVLPGRENIVLTRGDFTHEWVTVLPSVEDLEQYLLSKSIEKAYICWGSQIYEEFFRNGKTNEVILSVIDLEPEWDTAFPYFEEDFTKFSQAIHEWFTIEHWIRGDHPHMNPYEN
jgi:dihydrofolate reductase